MTAGECSRLVLDLARVLHANGQATEQTVGAAERLARALGMSATIMPRWGEIEFMADRGDGSVTAQIALETTVGGCG